MSYDTPLFFGATLNPNRLLNRTNQELSCDSEHQALAASLDVLPQRRNRWRVLPAGKRPLQTSDSGSMRPHSSCHLPLSKPRFLPRFEQGIEQHGLFTLNTLHLARTPGRRMSVLTS